MLVGANAAVTIMHKLDSLIHDKHFNVLANFVALFQPSSAVALHSIVLKLYRCIHLHKCSRYVQFYLNYRVNLGLLHTCRSDLVWN